MAVPPQRPTPTALPFPSFPSSPSRDSSTVLAYCRSSPACAGDRGHAVAAPDAGGTIPSPRAPRETAILRVQRLPSVQQLWPPRLGVMELGIVECKGLLSMRTADGKGCIDAYAVAKYGPKWTRMCTIADSYCWNRTNTHERGGLEHRTHKKLAAGRSTRTQQQFGVDTRTLW